MGTQGRSKGPRSDRPSWPEERATDLTTLPSFWPEQMTEAVLVEATHPSWLPQPSEQPDPLWDRWFERAVEEGVEEDLASLGRSLMREAHAQGWDEERCGECGWFDEGEAMLELALLDPEHAEARWRRLLDGF